MMTMILMQIEICIDEKTPVEIVRINETTVYVKQA